MEFFKILAVGLVLGLVQGSLEVAWSLGISPPDVLLLAVIWFGMNRRTTTGLAIAFIGGLMMDLVAPHPAVGVQSLCKVVVAYLPEWAHYVLLPETRFTGFVLVATGTLMNQVLLLTIVQTLKPGGVWGTGAIWEAAGLLFVNLCAWSLLSLWLPPVGGEKAGA